MASFALNDDRYSYTLVVPLISFGLLWLRRKTIFANAQYCHGTGPAMVLAGVALLVATRFSSRLDAEYALSIGLFAVLAIWSGAFVWCYGTHAARRAIFPLVFLLLTIPIPSVFLDHVAIALQRGSAEVAYRLFKLAGVPAVRKSVFEFSLPGVTVEVAKECSGIRSTLSLFIGSILTGYLFLRSGWSRALLVVLTIPIAIFKNAVRIVTISWLGVYVDNSFFTGRLHHQGGPLFFLVALVFVMPLLFLLARTERRRKTGSGTAISPA